MNRFSTNKREKFNGYLLAIVVLLAFCWPVYAESSLQEQVLQEEPPLVLPPKAYVVQGVPLTLYYDNLVFQYGASEYQYETQCEIGHAESNGWVLGRDNPALETYPIAITLTDETGAAFQFNSNVVVSQPQCTPSQQSRLPANRR